MNTRLYYTDDCILSLPTGFRDVTTQLLEWPTTDGDSIVLAVQRESVPEPFVAGAAEAFDFDAYVAGQLQDYPAKFPGIRLEREEAIAPRGIEVRRKTFRWKKDGDVLYHHQVFALAPPRVLIFTAASKARYRAEVDALADRIIADLKFRVD